MATFIFLAKDSPRYYKGYGVCCGALVLSGLMGCIYAFGITRENRLRAEGKAGIVVEEGYEGEDVGDEARTFRYMR